MIRGYAGGIHASNEKTCVFFTSLSLFFCIVAMKLCSDYFLIPVLLTLLFLGAICILILSPLDTEAKRLTKDEKKEFRKKSLFYYFYVICCIDSNGTWKGPHSFSLRLWFFP